MVSLRRRKLLGLCSGRSSFIAPLPRFFNGTAPEYPTQNTNPVRVHPVPSGDVDQPVGNKVGPGSSNESGSSSSKEQPIQPVAGPPVKRRKRHRRKHFQNQEPCLMRGVYFKNMKWQAAIKVDKKQIHLGTVGSQEEAARLYDRAAFMCGREPNFELSEEEKQELRKFKWEEFLAITRHAITSKKHKRRLGPGLQRSSESSLQNSEWDGKHEVNGLSASEDVEPDTSPS
ncbi:ethylene-responsive transcription factor-like protein At4g13040 [Alnus glutinosa]|uniref:ethylene-responsive transcription factor-like protein At4g13040 n=1 Tax=Alnus glutinosa TaxID=3517 RepID=UPI002D7845E2|nr:ethylene-responsive transcription factor-like protein At4g13040 [Alnus glutinosa]XP_062156200.1 ethylene-responsive transcription factor-like protein At4g13040 [Alnus glutinosa]XP_062156201.1 ethylene-responsive transcription factor-like protein At4g13040 [Alnus glutinosa]XP_062156202.1 ethylene-responsive transcription factor-like protein At4g13040 [Alnus glutinosa]XP_062156204.1 ethylene-responsive transcription factor-like protein At4g13040 [Alnus glutinosa]XP_062156205.1 ethylene-respon